MQKRWARFVEPHRFVAQWYVDGLGGRKRIGAIENARFRVNLRRGVEQQVLKRGVQALRTARLAFAAIKVTSVGG